MLQHANPQCRQARQTGEHNLFKGARLEIITGTFRGFILFCNMCAFRGFIGFIA
jgi:hypothetical protein